MTMREHFYKRSFILPMAILAVVLFWARESFAVTNEHKAIEYLEKSVKVEPMPEQIARPQLAYSSDNLTDPFKPAIVRENKDGLRPQEQPSKPLPALSVQGIIWGGKLPLAIINGHVVKIEDEIEGARLVDIGKEGVTLIFSGMQYKLASPMAKQVDIINNPKEASNEKNN